MTATQSQVRSSIASERKQLIGDALVASDVKDILTEAYAKCAVLMRDASDGKRAQDVLNMLEDVESEARSWQVESEG